MDWIDVTVPIRPGMPAYPGDPPVEITRVASVEAGDVYSLTRLSLGAHAGTHVDAPAHFIAGAPGVEGLDTNALIGRARVADATAVDGALDAAALAALGLPAGCERLLLQTASSPLRHAPALVPGYTALTEGGARWLVEHGLRLVGIDSLSVAPFDDPAPVHLELLRAGVVILEGLDLRAVTPGDYMLVCLPLLIPGADGAPARALLGREPAPAPGV